MTENITSAKNCWHDRMILLFTSVITSAFAECRRELEWLKLSLAKYHCLHRKPYNFMFSVTTERLYKSLFYKFFCTNLSQVVLRRFYTKRFLCNDFCDPYLFNPIISYKSEKAELTRSFKNRIIHILMRKVATIS